MHWGAIGMRAKTVFSALLMGAVLSFSAAAQTLSPAEIMAKVNEKTASANEYQALLNDPDPSRSMAAMEVMLESGDPKLQRMALDYGLFSPNKLVQYAALKAFFQSRPVLRLYIDGSGVKDQDYFTRSIGELSGTVDQNKRGFVTMKVGEFDPKGSCYRHTNYNSCFVRISETEVAINPWRNNWVQLTLNDQGELIGVVGFVPPAPIMVPVTN
jgi:hypothetical protein